MAKSKYESVYGAQHKQRILCHRCQKTHVVMYVNPGDNPRALCFQCKKRENDARNAHVEEETDYLLNRLAHHMLVNHGAGEVKVFKPGDRGFKQRAQEFFENRRAERQKVYHFNTFGRSI